MVAPHPSRRRPAPAPAAPPHILPSIGFSGRGILGLQTTGNHVVRFHREARLSGIDRFEKGGFHVASVTDFKGGPAEATAQALQSADIAYFPRFGIAIVHRDGERLQSMVAGAQSADIATHRPELIFRHQPGPFDAAYLEGLRDGFNAAIDHLVHGTQATVAAASTTEIDRTWGLDAILVGVSHYSGLGIKLAMLDTGIDLTHPDFAGRPIISKSFVDGEVAQDGNGHGTHTAGTACGPLRPAGQPRYGVAYNATVYAGKVLANSGSGAEEAVLGGIHWALDEGCQVISMSLASPVGAGDAFVQDYDTVGKVALDESCLIVAAAGNFSRRGQGVIAPVASPANCPSILSVGAVDSALQIADFSCGSVNSGQNVDLVGPGVDVLSSWPGGYNRLSGTSMATPHVAGVACLYAEADPQNRGLALWAAIAQHCHALALPATDCGKGLVQAI